MKKSFHERHNSNKKVCKILKNNLSSFSHIQIFIDILDKLETQVENTNFLLTRVKYIPGKAKENKNLSRIELISIVLKISNVLNVYANLKENVNLSNFVVSSENKLCGNLKQRKLLNYAKKLDRHVSPIMSELAYYGLTEKLLTELRQEIIEFEELLAKPDKTIKKTKTNNESIEERIDQTYKLLITQLDPLMELFVDDIIFYLDYKSARMETYQVKRRRRRRRKVTITSKKKGTQVRIID